MPRSVPFNDTDYFGPTIAAAGNSIVIAAADASTQAQQVDYWWSPALDSGACGDVDYWWQRVGTTPWNHQRVYTNPSPPGPGGC